MDTILPRQGFNLPVFQDKNFISAEKSDVFHGFFGRQGGVSGGVYDSLNCGLGSGDTPAHVTENRMRVAQVSGVEPENLLSLYQVHGDTCLLVDAAWRLDGGRPKADSFVTDKPGFGLGILTADCAPVLFYGQKADGSPVVGAAHAGWKGALGGVLERTVVEMKGLEAMPSHLRACIGPCIGKASYMVKTDFIGPFLDEDQESERFFHASVQENHVMFDLAGYCAWRLFRAGVKNVSILDQDTYAQEERFFSYRRATHRNEPDYARQISVVSIQP